MHPQRVGPYSFAVKASNSAGSIVSPTRTVTITAKPVFTADSPPDGTEGQSYSYIFTASGYPAPTFSLASGTLPPGMDLAGDGSLSGTPTQAGSYTFAVSATNSSDTAATPDLTITIAAAQGASSISTGGYHSCALESGRAYCWGYNFNGQRGDGSAANSSVPAAVNTSGVLAGKNLTQITAGDVHTCVLDSSGAAYCWGWNVNGDLGDGSTVGSDVPVAVNTSGVLAGKDLTQITAGEHTCALDSTGAAYCWGFNGVVPT